MASILTPIGILSFPVLFSPRPRAQNAEAVYSCNLLFDEEAQKTAAFANLKRAVLDEIENKCGIGKTKDANFMKGLRSPFRPTEDRPYAGYDIPNGVFIAPWTKSRPGVVDAKRVEIIMPEDVWAGQMARASVTPFYYMNSGNKGVSFALNNLQICRSDGIRLDGRRQAKDEFPEYDGAGAMTADAADDIPF